MERFSFDKVTFARGNCPDRRNPVLLRGCFRPDCKAACSKLLYTFMYLPAEGVTILETDLQMYPSLHSHRRAQTRTKSRIYQPLIVLTDFSGTREKTQTFGYVKVVLAVPCSQCSQDRNTAVTRPAVPSPEVWHFSMALAANSTKRDSSLDFALVCIRFPSVLTSSTLMLHTYH